MQPPFTLGLLGGCGKGRSTAKYFESVVNYYLKTFSRIRFLLPVTTVGERSVASHLLECRAGDSRMEIYLMLSSRQWSNYISGVSGDRSEECCRIIAAADHCEILPGSKVILSQSALFRLFIERCDLIIFHEHRAGWRETEGFDAQGLESGVPIPVQYRLGAPGYAAISYPPDRREYLDSQSVYYDPAAEYGQSTSYIRRNGFSIQSDRLPMIFLRKWLAELPTRCYRYLMSPEDLSALFFTKDRPNRDCLSLKAFAFAYTTRRGKKEVAYGNEAINRFMQFRELLERIAAKREEGEPVEPFDLLDFGAYDELIKTFAIDGRTQPSERSETASEADTQNSIHKGRTAENRSPTDAADSANATERSDKWD